MYFTTDIFIKNKSLQSNNLLALHGTHTQYMLLNYHIENKFWEDYLIFVDFHMGRSVKSKIPFFCVWI